MISSTVEGGVLQIHSKYKFGIQDSNGQLPSHTTTQRALT
jgi:hypothetical protein